MRRLLAATLFMAVSLLGVPAASTHDVDRDIQAEVQEAVGPAVQVILVEDSKLNAAFLEGCVFELGMCLDKPTILFLGDWTVADPEMIRMVAYHEYGHYLQALHGWPLEEWGADVYAADRLCAEGHDGPRAAYRVARLLLEEYDVSWAAGHDDNHGSWAERLANLTEKAPNCQKYARRVEAPYAPLRLHVPARLRGNR